MSYEAATFFFIVVAGIIAASFLLVDLMEGKPEAMTTQGGARASCEGKAMKVKVLYGIDTIDVHLGSKPGRRTFAKGQILTVGTEISRDEAISWSTCGCSDFKPFPIVEVVKDGGTGPNPTD